MATVICPSAGRNLGSTARLGCAARKPCVRLGHRAVVSKAPRRTYSPIVPSAAAVVAPDAVTQMTDAQRKQFAEELGYRTIGKELPDDVTLNQVVKSLPPEVFELDEGKAWAACVTSVVSFGLSLYLISIAPWYLLPLAWFFSGTAFTGWFVIGHDCGHRSFSKNKLLEDIVGTIAFMPLVYPFEPWRIKHNHHHAHTNKLVEDTAWHPATEEAMAAWSPTQRWLYTTFLGTPLKLFASVGHQLIWHFNLDLFTEQQKPRVIVSLAAVAAFMLIGWPLLFYYTGWEGFVKYWLMPWLGYHFWMSTFTVVHHTAPHIPFKAADDWNAAKAQLSGTVHCDYPRWVEFLCHDINVHVPHHVNSRIPWYNLRKATDSLRQNWGEYMTECTFNWRMVKNIITECHVYDKDKNYKPYDFKGEEPQFAFWRKVLPNTM